MKELPQELIVQILLRLPVKSLVRFRAVCKAWLSLISDPSFAKSHFEGSSTSHNHRILYTVASARQAWSVDFNAPLHDDSAASKIEVPFATTQLRAPVRILGSCRGILLLVLRDFEVVNGLITWNPSTGSIKIIPKAPMLEQKFPLLCGLGYDASTDDYLVAQASYHYGIDVPLTIFETFSVKTNSWRKVEAEGFNQSGTQLMEADYFGCPREGYLLNGAIHWLAFPLYGVVGNRGAIIAFDLKEKGLQELPIPNDFDYESCNLGVFGGLLGVADLNSPGEVGIWVMTDYGVKSSWIHLFTVSLAVIDSIYFLPLCLSKGGELVGIGDQGLVKLGKNGELLEQHEYCHDKMDFSVNGSVYTESLLSLPISHGDESEDR